jgi:hypothetical protein
VPHHLNLLVVATLLSAAGDVACGQTVDPETKNHYRASDLAPFNNATEWNIFSLDPMPWEEMPDPFGSPAPKSGESDKKSPEPKEPKRKVSPEQEFHGYPILGQTKVALTDQLKTVISTIDESGRHWTGGVAACFNPRHGIRVIKNGESHDLLICYECFSAILFRGSKQTGVIHFATDPRLTPRPAYLNGALIRANVKMPPPPRH